MKKPVGPLGWTAEERQEYARTGKWPMRDPLDRTTRSVEAPEWRPGLRPGPPSPDFLRGYFAALRQSGQRGPKSKFEEHVELTIECLRDADYRTEDARKLYVARRAPGMDTANPGVERDTSSREFSRALKILQTLWGSE
jgi:hypothetical protein